MITRVVVVVVADQDQFLQVAVADFLRVAMVVVLRVAVADVTR